MNIGEKISFLLERYANNNCSFDEFNELFTLINNSENKEEVLLKLKNIWDNEATKATHTDEEWDLLYTSLIKDPDPETEIRPKARRLLWQRITAAAVILVTLSAALLFYKGRSQKRSIMPQQSFTENPQLVPGGDKAILTLANGSKIALDGKANGLVASQSGVKITKSASGQLIYKLENVSRIDQTPGAGEPISYNTIETPRGGQYQILMPDGTKVWLNAMSSLKYPVVFDSRERKVELKGEGYFEVAKNKNAPFKIFTSKQIVEVLGTHFNINAYADESNTRTTLLEGVVKVSPLKNGLAVSAEKTRTLVPNQQANLAGTGVVNVTNVDTGLAVAWKNGNFIFNKDNLVSIMRQISRWYDVEIIYTDERVKNEVFSGSVSRFENAEELLNIFQLTGLVHFKVEGKKIIVSQ